MHDDTWALKRDLGTKRVWGVAPGGMRVKLSKSSPSQEYGVEDVDQDLGGAGIDQRLPRREGLRGW